jgi:hypothetical protein
VIVALVTVFLLGPQPVAADDTSKVLTQRVLVDGRYAIVANGVGMTASSSADIALDVPGTVYKAYLYWAGYDDGSGDDTVSLQVDGGAVNSLTADETFKDFWFGSYHRYVYVEEITGLVQSGDHTYTVAGFSDSFHFRDGAGLLVVYEDAGLPYNRVEVKDGLDRMYRWWGSGARAESAVNCFDVPAHPDARTMSLNIFGTGVDISGDDRPNALWYRTGDDTETQPEDMLNTPTDGPVDTEAIELQGPPDYPFQSVNGEEWDTYTNTITIPAEDTWVCLQVESAEYESYQPASFAQMVAAATYEIGASIGDTVWIDTDGDGVQDGGESGLSGVTVWLYDDADTLVGTTTTDGNGLYLFDDLAPGDYYLKFEQPSGYMFTHQDRGGDASDSDAEPTTGKTIVTALGPGEVDLTWDAGLVSEVDLGDLPDTYGTLIASDGARHISGTLYLGAAFDSDPDGAPTSDATGDDTGDGSDDEDGIVRDPDDLWQPNNTVNITATVSGGEGTLAGWFDWNNDGDFEDTGESFEWYVFAGDNSLQVGVGDDYTTGTQLYARFRLYPGEVGETSPTGLVSGGEVEDYRWSFGPNAVTLTSLWGRARVLWVSGFLAVLAGFAVFGVVGTRRKR